MTIPKDRLPNDSMLHNGMGYAPAMHLSQMKVSNQGLPTRPPGPKQPLALASMGLCNPVIVMDWLPPRHKGQATGPHSGRHLGRIGQLSIHNCRKKKKKDCLPWWSLTQTKSKIRKYKQCTLMHVKRWYLTLIWVSSSKGTCDRVIYPR